MVESNTGRPDKSPQSRPDAQDPYAPFVEKATRDMPDKKFVTGFGARIERGADRVSGILDRFEDKATHGLPGKLRDAAFDFSDRAGTRFYDTTGAALDAARDKVKESYPAALAKSAAEIVGPTGRAQMAVVLKEEVFVKEPWVETGKNLKDLAIDGIKAGGRAVADMPHGLADGVRDVATDVRNGWNGIDTHVRHELSSDGNVIEVVIDGPGVKDQLGKVFDGIQEGAINFAKGETKADKKFDGVMDKIEDTKVDVIDALRGRSKNISAGEAWRKGGIIVAGATVAIGAIAFAKDTHDLTAAKAEQADKQSSEVIQVDAPIPGAEKGIPCTISGQEIICKFPTDKGSVETFGDVITPPGGDTNNDGYGSAAAHFESKFGEKVQVDGARQQELAPGQTMDVKLVDRDTNKKVADVIVVREKKGASHDFQASVVPVSTKPLG